MWKVIEEEVKNSLPLLEEEYSKKWYKRYMFPEFADLIREVTFSEEEDSLKKLKSIEFWNNL